MTDENEQNEEEKTSEEDSSGLVFTEEQAEIPFKIKKKDGRVVEYILREMMGPALGEWQTYDAGRMKLNKRRIEMAPDAFKKYAATLIGLCAFELPANSPVPVKEIMGWKSSIITKLFETAQTMNGLNDEGKEQAKKV